MLRLATYTRENAAAPNILSEKILHFIFFSFTHNIQKRRLFVLPVSPPPPHTGDGTTLLLCQHEKEEIGITQNPVLQKHDPVASPEVRNTLLLSSVLKHTLQRWGTSGRWRLLSYYWIWGCDKKNRPRSVRCLPEQHPAASPQTSSLHLLRLGYSAFTFPYPVFHFHLLDWNIYCRDGV